MNKPTKIALHCAGWGVALCAVLISPVILVYSVPVAVGVVSDIVHAGGGPVVAGSIVSAVAHRALALAA
jgi:hypothetical protein